jgi:outer membrane immunogenic protein
MKKILLAGLVLSSFAGSAMAADLARPVYKAPPPVEVFDWSGIYIGGHIGGGWSWTDVTDHTFFGNNLFIPTQHINNSSGFLGGVQGGWNYQIGRFVLGSEIDFSWTDIKGDQTSPILAGILGSNVFRSSKANWTGTATTRLGYAWDHVLFYTKIGAAWANFDYVDTVTIVGIPVYTSPASETRSGWTVGTGIEWAFLGGWSAKIEYDYIDFGRRTVDFNPVAGIVPVNLDIDQRISEVKFGLNYRFGAGAFGGPLMAKY